MSYDLDKEWTLMLVPHIMTSGYKTGVGWDTTAPNGLRETLAQTEAGLCSTGFLSVQGCTPRQNGGSISFLSRSWRVVRCYFPSIGIKRSAVGFFYQHLFSFGTLLTNNAG